MIDTKIVEQIKQASITERIRLAEIILQSLKHELNMPPVTLVPSKPFKIHGFDLGQKVRVDRDSLYPNRPVI